LSEEIRQEDTIQIASIETVSQEISDSIISVSQILQQPYVSGIRDKVLGFLKTIDNIFYILKEWNEFQRFYLILREVFSMDEAKSILPVVGQQFLTLQEKWLSVAPHTLKDPR
jgi:hypothetical protein